MSLFYKVSDRELVKLKNDIFKERGIPALTQNGFSRSPFSTGWFGKNDAGGYSYEFCRVGDESRLDMILVYINKNDRWVQLHLNIFRLSPNVNSIEQLKGVDGLQFHMPPNSSSLSRITAPRGLIFAGFPKHKIRFFFSRAGLKSRLERLGNLLENDLKNIDSFVLQWIGERKPLTTDWKGVPINNNVDKPPAELAKE